MNPQDTVKAPAGPPAAPPGDRRPGEALAERTAPRPGRRARATAWARANPLLVAAIVAGLVARIVFWVATDRVIDDALITIKFAKNLADGFGLVHNLGEGHVQGFTSALSVLVPIPGELIAPGGGLTLLRLVSLAAFVLTAVYGYRIARELRIGPWPTGFALAYLALDQNQVFYGMAGMETQIAVAVLLAGIYYVLVTDYVKSGVALGLALLARPDFVLWIAPAYLFLLWRNPPRALRAGLISAAIVLPWIVFTTVYYGSPIPNTIVAKSSAFGPHFPAITDIMGWNSYLGNLFTLHSHDWTVLAPFYERVFVLQAPLPYQLLKAIALVVAALAIVGAVTTWKRRSWRPAIGFVILFALYKFFYLTTGYFEWYGVPAIAVIVLLAAAGLDRTAGFVAARTRRGVRLSGARLVAIPAVLLGIAYGMQCVFTIPLEARIQHRIEDRVREPLGRYLGRVVKPGQSISSESSGYIGYDTNATLYDFPGLVSPAAVDALRHPPPNTLGLIAITAKLHPDWLVARPGEWDTFKALSPPTARQYRPVRRFRVSAASTPLDFGGLHLTDVDRDFIVLRRQPAGQRRG